MVNWFRCLFDRFVTERRKRAEAQARKAQQRRASAQRRRERERHATLRRARALMSRPFVIADLETTGFSSDDEILEFAAIRVLSTGAVCESFTTLVNIRGRVPQKVTALTGISNALVRKHGVGLHRAFEEFVDFCDGGPVFFHNAGFDVRFLRAAAHRLGTSFDLPAYCSLKVARAAWPELRSHRLEVLARLIGAPAPTHRGLDDVYTTLAVLAAAMDDRPVAAAT